MPIHFLSQKIKPKDYNIVDFFYFKRSTRSAPSSLPNPTFFILEIFVGSVVAQLELVL